MGAYSPAPILDEQLTRVVMDGVIAPMMKGLRKERMKFRGVIYVGLMICDGKPYVLEYNVRFGDPEAQPILMRLDSDLFDLLKATAEGKLKDVAVTWKDEASICVVLAAEGYPGSYKKGRVITGLDSFKGSTDIVVFHAGTGSNNGDTVTTGGRVLGVTALGRDIATAKANVYGAVEKIHFEGMQFRTDIADKAIKRG
jgi:phosphoribosylamine--glycine ligase